MEFDIYHYAREAKKAVEVLSEEVDRLEAENEALEKRLQDIQKEREVLFTKFHGYRDEIVELKISKEKALKYFNALSELWPDLPHSDTIFEEIVYLMKMRENKIRAQAVRDALRHRSYEAYTGNCIIQFAYEYANKIERGEV